MGAAAQISESIASGGFGQPHNDYLGTYCDTGLLGSILFWGVFLPAGARSVMLAVRTPDRQHHTQLHARAGLLVMALVLFAVTDNPMVYIGHLMTPLAAVLGLSDAIYQRPRARACGRAASPAPRTLAASPTGYGMSVTERRK